MKKIIPRLLLIALLLAACSTTTHKTTTHPKTSRTEHERVVDIQRVDQEQNVETEDETSPALTLVSEGIQKFKDDLVEEAEWKFEEAINLDPDYGPAYYWLARIKYRQEDLEQCSEFIKKAESLLRDSTTWMERIDEFKNILSGIE